MLLKYFFFAAIAILLNTLIFTLLYEWAQTWITEGIYRLLAEYIAKACGIVAGFALKYFLDKNYVFADEKKESRQEAKQIGLYGLFSIFTTLLAFGLAEVGEWLINHRYEATISWLLGLVVGYTTKYYLDKNFVFVQGTK